MEENRPIEPTEAQDGKKHKKRKRLPRQFRMAVAALVTVALLLLAMLAYMYRDYLTEEGLRSLFGGEKTESTGEAFSYEAGAKQSFALAGNGLAIASTTGLQLLDENGYSAARQVFSMSEPNVVGSSVHAAFFDVGGTALRVADFKGNCTTLDTSDTIISVSMNSSGWMAVCTEELGYKGCVTVYNASLKEVYRWHSGSGWLLKAVVSADCSRLAALCLQADGGAVRFFDLSSEDEQGVFQTPDELLADIAFVGDRVCAISEDNLYFTDTSGNSTGSFGFEGTYLSEYSLSGSDYAVIYLSNYRGGGGGNLISINTSGEELGRVEMQSDITSLSVYSRGVVVCLPAGLEKYSRTMSLQSQSDDAAGVKYVLCRDKGDILLISSYGTELFNF